MKKTIAEMIEELERLYAHLVANGGRGYYTERELNTVSHLGKRLHEVACSVLTRAPRMGADVDILVVLDHDQTAEGLDLSSLDEVQLADEPINDGLDLSELDQVAIL